MPYWLTRFKDGPETYIAYGSDPDRLPVFHVRSDSHVRTMMFFPGCLRFIPYADVGELGQMEAEDVTRAFGEQLDATLPDTPEAESGLTHLP